MAKGEARAEDQAALEARRRVEQQREREKRARERAQLGGLWARRGGVGGVGGGVFAAVSGGARLAGVWWAVPRGRFPPPSPFRAGVAARYAHGGGGEEA